MSKKREANYWRTISPNNPCMKYGPSSERHLKNCKRCQWVKHPDGPGFVSPAIFMGPVASKRLQAALERSSWKEKAESTCHARVVGKSWLSTVSMKIRSCISRCSSIIRFLHGGRG